MARSVMSPNEEMPKVAPIAVIQPAPPQLDNPGKMQRPFMDGDFEFVSHCWNTQYLLGFL